MLWSSAEAGASVARLWRTALPREQQFSQLRAAPLKDAADWLGSYQRFWDASFERLGERLGSQ
jgi:hypothetical protein